MPEITSQTFGVTLDAFFEKAVLLKDARIPEIAQMCLEAFASYGLSPKQIALRHGDSLFNYDLAFPLFGGNGSFAISAEKLHLDFKNARGDKDGEIIADCIAKLNEHVPLPEFSTTPIEPEQPFGPNQAPADVCGDKRGAISRRLRDTAEIVWRRT